MTLLQLNNFENPDKNDTYRLIIPPKFWLVGWFDVFNVPSTARSFRDGTPIYCPFQNFGETSMNSLNTILNTDDSGNNDTAEINILKKSSYHDFNTFVDTTKETTHNFSIFSSNIELLNAKFSEISIFVKLLKENHFNFSLLCFQECWISENSYMSLFS